jgi:hypothetical protein
MFSIFRGVNESAWALLVCSRPRSGIAITSNACNGKGLILALESMFGDAQKRKNK